MTPSVLFTAPDRIDRSDISVMQQHTVDDLPHIQALWPHFETLVGLKGRKMYAMVYPQRNEYIACTPVRPGDDPDEYGLRVSTLPGGRYLRGRLVGQPPEVFGLIGPGMGELEASVEVDHSRPLVEFYRRHDRIELWVPVSA